MSARNLAVRTALVASVAAGIYWIAGGPATATPAARAEKPVDARDLYDLQCSSCHGANGAGIDGRAPSLVGEGEAAVDFVLRTGRMPMADPSHQTARGPVRFTEAEIRALVTYVGSWGQGPPIPDIDVALGDVAVGGDLYRLNCAACHVASGSGSVIGGGRRAPSLMRASPVEVAEAIVVGPGAMPIFGELTATDIVDIAAYVDDLQARGTTDADSLGGVGPVAEGLAAWLLALIPLVAVTRWIGVGHDHGRSVSDDEGHHQGRPVPHQAHPE